MYGEYMYKSSANAMLSSRVEWIRTIFDQQ